MHTINDCPRCGKDFMYDPKLDINLLRVKTGDIIEVFVICQKCNEDEINQ